MQDAPGDEYTLEERFQFSVEARSRKSERERDGQRLRRPTWPGKPPGKRSVAE